MTKVYSFDLASYKLWEPLRADSAAILLHGTFDITPDNEEITVDRKYPRKLRINADDLVESAVINGSQASVFSIDQAKKVHKFIQEAVRDNYDIIIHCHAGVSRTGAIVETCLYYYNLPVVHVNKWKSGRKLEQRLIDINTENFAEWYSPNPLWSHLLASSLK